MLNGGSLAPFGMTGLEKSDTSVPTGWDLEQNYPNPFNSTTTFSFALPQTSTVTLKIYDALGKEVATVVNEHLAAGRYNYSRNAGDLASGIYIYRIAAISTNAEKKHIARLKDYH